MAYTQADTLAIVSFGLWTARRVQILSELTVVVVDVTSLTVVVT